jgi:hypothetical protein
METRTPDLYRVKAASLCTTNHLEGVEGPLSTCKYSQDGIFTGEITGEEIFVRALRLLPLDITSVLPVIH